MFSSPIGESTFSTEKRNAGNYRSKSFRPLSGNLLSLPKDEDAFVTNMYCVFVPYRGIYFLYLVSVSITRTCNRFRPLSGNLLSLLNNVTVKYAKKEFSSPIGESTFSTFCKPVHYKGNFGFSSPIGESTFSTKLLNLNNTATLSFRPLSGNLLSLHRHVSANRGAVACFRPLSGNLLSLLQYDNFKTWCRKLVFVPYRGIYFLYEN